jgi:hypothetical protein
MRKVERDTLLRSISVFLSCHHVLLTLIGYIYDPELAAAKATVFTLLKSSILFQSVPLISSHRAQTYATSLAFAFALSTVDMSDMVAVLSPIVPEDVYLKRHNFEENVRAANTVSRNLQRLQRRKLWRVVDDVSSRPR